MRALAHALDLRRLSPSAVAATLCALVLAFGAAACNDDESPGPEAGGGGEPQQIPDEAEGQLEGEVTMAELLENPDQYFGQQVTVSGAVAQTLVSPGAFTLGASVEGGGEEGVGEGGGSSELLVLPRGNAQTPQAEITESDAVQVTGTVCQVVANIQEEEEFLFEEEEAEAGFLSDFQDQPAIFATSIDADIPEENQEGEGAIEEGAQEGTGTTAQGTVTVQGEGSCPAGTTGG